MSKRNYGLIATKRPRDDSIEDRAINFPPLENLHLELLENKSKIKSGAPDIISPPKKKKEKKEEVIKDASKKEAPKKESHSKDEKEVPKKEPPKKEPPKKETKEDMPDEIIIDEYVEDDDDIKDIQGSDDEDEEDINDSEEIDDLDLAEEEEEDEKDDDEKDEEDEEDEKDEEDEEEKEEKKEEKKEEDDEYAGLTPAERERKEKEEYIWRFRILKKKFKNPSIDIPSFNEHSELSEMKSAYDRTTKELYLDNCVDSYRTYLLGGFMLVEFACTNWLGVDFSGFTKSQTSMMYKYDMLLIELGEKSYSNWGAKIPVEIRLAGMIILQAGLFYLGKIISSKFGNGTADIFRGFTGQPPESVDKKEDTTKKKMKGPRIKAEEIRNMANIKKDE